MKYRNCHTVHLGSLGEAGIKAGARPTDYAVVTSLWACEGVNFSKNQEMLHLVRHCEMTTDGMLSGHEWPSGVG